jgi:predicted  nucleic acid-binding Zn-ribbon protein
LARRQSELEDVELEVMERLEDVQNRLTALRTEYADVEKAAADLRMRRDDTVADIGKDREFVQRQRADQARELPEDLAKLYEKLRADNGGVGAARLHQGRCEGCRLELNATEISKARAAEPDAVLRCEECRRILVRTNESGL